METLYKIFLGMGILFLIVSFSTINGLVFLAPAFILTIVGLKGVIETAKKNEERRVKMEAERAAREAQNKVAEDVLTEWINIEPKK